MRWQITFSKIEFYTICQSQRQLKLTDKCMENWKTGPTRQDGVENRDTVYWTFIG